MSYRRWRQLAWLAALVGCAHAGDETRPRMFHPIEPGAPVSGLTPLHPVACGVAPQKCLEDGRELLKRGDVTGAFRALYAACLAGSEPACDFLNDRFRGPRNLGELPPLLPARLRSALQHDLWAKLSMLCHLTASGVLRDCSGQVALSQDSPALVEQLTLDAIGWLNGHRMPPAQLDGQPVDCMLPIRLNLGSH